jgi:mRNA-degrading endonuclease RelE of RelBE toxin-antitoxin system
MKQPQDKKTVDIEDIMLWPDGEWCYRYELSEFMRVRSDDYRVLYLGTSEHNAIISAGVN